MSILAGKKTISCPKAISVDMDEMSDRLLQHIVSPERALPSVGHAAQVFGGIRQSL